MYATEWVACAWKLHVLHREQIDGAFVQFVALFLSISLLICSKSSLAKRTDIPPRLVGRCSALRSSHAQLGLDTVLVFHCPNGILNCTEK